MRHLHHAALGVCLVLLAGVSAYGQSALEASATRRISQETGIPQHLIRTLFVEQQNAQFILAFIYINEQSVNSELKPEIRTAIAPFVDRNALLVLAVPARRSFFDPFEISFVQNIFRVPVVGGMVTPVTPDFARGELPSGVVSAGVIALDSRVLVTQTFEVHYAGTFSASFNLNPEADRGNSGQGGGLFGDGFRFLLLNLLFLFLFPFLLL